MEDIKYEPIKIKSVEVLIKNGCRADDWSTMYVAEGFDPVKVVNTVFKGEVRIGSLQGDIETPEGIRSPASISGANLNNVTIGNNCHIRNIHSWILNMDIGSEVVIVNVGKIVCIGETSFGNGHEVAVLNEAGGRELKITTRTSAQVAYLNVMYRDRKTLIEKLEAMAERFADSVKSSRGYIGNNAHITNSGKITNVYIGEHAQISGISSLHNGTIVSSKDAPTVVGNGVIAEDFIFQKCSVVKDRAMISSILVGEGTIIGSQLSAENSLLFANSEGFNSEMCSVFAGPYSVTHHKSTLLIAGLFSFYNAGSGTNQSNHMYKLGPVHQGILERGCKTGSFSYLLWPSRVGPFTAILGKHYANFDTSDFPFSYINEENGKSAIIPGMNYLTIGTLRDAEKWPSRDRRKFKEKLDLIIFNMLSPYTGQKMIKGQEILTGLKEKSEKGQEYVTYNGIRIKRLLLNTCRRYYKLILNKYFGDILVGQVEEKSPGTIQELLKRDESGVNGDSTWIDVCGLLCAKSRIDTIIKDITSGAIDTFDKMQDALKEVYNSYRSDEWNWFLAQYKKLNSCELADESCDNILKLLDDWKDSSTKLLNIALNDATKEYEGNVKISFGIDGNRDEDFEAVRGRPEDNKVVKKLKNDIEEINTKYKKVKKLIHREGNRGDTLIS